MCSTGLGLFTQGTSKENIVKVNTTHTRHAQHSSHPLQSRTMGRFPRESSNTGWMGGPGERGAAQSCGQGERNRSGTKENGLSSSHGFNSLETSLVETQTSRQKSSKMLKYFSYTDTGPHLRAAGLGAQPGLLSRAAATSSSSKLRQQQWQYYGIIYTLTGLFTSLFKSF